MHNHKNHTAGMMWSQVASHVKVLASRKHSHTKPFVRKKYTKKCSPHLPTINQPLPLKH